MIRICRLHLLKCLQWWLKVFDHPQILHRRRQVRLRHLTWVWSFRWVNSTITMSNFQVLTPLSKKVLIFLPNLKIFVFLLRHCWDSKICVNLLSDVCRNISKAQSPISPNYAIVDLNQKVENFFWILYDFLEDSLEAVEVDKFWPLFRINRGKSSNLFIIT